jgi:hypothetical protein
MNTYEVYLVTKVVVKIHAFRYSEDKRLKRLVFQQARGTKAAETWFASEQVAGVHKVCDVTRDEGIRGRVMADVMQSIRSRSATTNRKVETAPPA